MRSKETSDGEQDYPVVARRLVLKIREARASSIGTKVETADPVSPDGVRRTYILDSLRHCAEVYLLRHIYKTLSFVKK